MAILLLLLLHFQLHSNLFSLGVSAKIFYKFLLSLTLSIFPAYFILVDLSVLMLHGER